jgi:hypothetical protein
MISNGISSRTGAEGGSHSFLQALEDGVEDDEGRSIGEIYVVV